MWRYPGRSAFYIPAASLTAVMPGARPVRPRCPAIWVGSARCRPASVKPFRKRCAGQPSSLTVLLVVLQYPLWFGKGIVWVWEVDQLQEQRELNQKLGSAMPH